MSAVAERVLLSQGVVIAVDPHKASWTAVAVTAGLQARMSCAAPIGSGTVDLALKPHASFHVLMPEATPMKPPSTSHPTSTIVARMSARPEATDAEFRRRWMARGLSRLGCPSIEKAWHRVRSSA